METCGKVFMGTWLMAITLVILTLTLTLIPMSEAHDSIHLAFLIAALNGVNILSCVGHDARKEILQSHLETIQEAELAAKLAEKESKVKMLLSEFLNKPPDHIL